MKSATPVLIVNLSVIIRNYKKILSFVRNSKVAAVVKADAYGLGARTVSKALAEAGCKDFFVATIKEGIILRKALIKFNSVNIYILHGVFNNDVKNLLKYDLIPVINHLEQLKIWQNTAINLNKSLKAILNVDTGIHRFGMLKDELEILINDIKFSQNIHFEYVMSHLACSDKIYNSFNLEQLKNFKKISSHFSNSKSCFANSDGAFLGDEYLFDMIRVGAGLYGINKNTDNPVSLYAPIIQIQKLNKGDYVGYGKSYKVIKPSVIATIAVGYADGFLRSFGKNGYLYLEKFKVPIVGRVSMDFLTIDVSEVPKTKVFLGAKVEIIGEHLHPNDLARNNKTIGYEIFTLLGRRYKKRYIKTKRCLL